VKYSNNVNVGTATVTVTGIGNYAGTKKLTFKINPVKLADAKLKTTTFTWSGSEKKPTATVTAKVNGTTKTLKAGTDYTITYKNNKSVGKATATIKGKGNYSGTKTKTFKINPKGTTLKASKYFTKTKTTVTVKWAKQANKMSTSRITGYEVQMATNKAFTKGKKTAKVKGYSSVSKKFTKLKSGKTYYVQVREIKKVGGVNYIGNISKPVAVKIK
jgi:hypothetical protein